MALTQWTAVSGLPASLASDLSSGLLEHRRTGEAQPVPVALETSAERGSLPAGTAAGLHAMLGAEAEALRWLRASLDDGTWVDQYLRVNPAYDGIRHRDDFRNILDQVGA